MIMNTDFMSQWMPPNYHLQTQIAPPFLFVHNFWVPLWWNVARNCYLEYLTSTLIVIWLPESKLKKKCYTFAVHMHKIWSNHMTYCHICLCTMRVWMTFTFRCQTVICGFVKCQISLNFTVIRQIISIMFSS